MSLTKEVKLEIVEKHGRGQNGDRFGGGAGCPPSRGRINDLTEHLRTHPEGSLLAARAPEARRPATTIPELHATKGHRGLPRPHQGARPAPVRLQRRSDREGGSLSEPAPPRRSVRADSNLHLAKHQRKGEGIPHMSTTTAGRIASVSVDVGGHEIVFETGKLAKQAGGAVVVRSATRWSSRHRGRRTLAADVDFFPLRSMSRSGCMPRARSPAPSSAARARSGEKGDPHCAHDRPTDPAALPQGLGHYETQLVLGDPDVGGPDQPLRHPRDERRLRGASDLTGPRRRSRRRGADRQARR